MPRTIEELEAAIQDTISQANSILFLNHNILKENENLQKKIQSLEKKLETDEHELTRCLDEINALKESWLTTLRTLVAQINETFSRNFQEMAVAGEVLLVLLDVFEVHLEGLRLIVDAVALLLGGLFMHVQGQSLQEGAEDQLQDVGGHHPISVLLVHKRFHARFQGVAVLKGL